MEKLALSVSEAAELLGVCPKVAYELTRRADFPAFKCGSRTIVSAEGLRDWVQRQATAGVAAGQ